MTAVLLILCLALIGLAIVQYRLRHTPSRELRYIEDKLARILAEPTAEKVHLHTSSPHLQGLLTVLNRLLEANRKLDATYVRKEHAMKQMVANMSHDLKTPLTVILGLTETIALDDRLESDERQRLARKVHEKSLDLLHLIHEMFDLARLESGDRTVPLVKLDACAVCRSSILFFYEMIESHGLEVDVQLPEQPVYIYANSDALGRVLHNLLSNAIRYGNDGGVVGIAVRQEPDNVAIEIWDRGKGIQEADRDRVFERLYTLEDSRNQNFQGSGLGLTITKRLVELMEGTIELTSIPQEQTVFTVHFRPCRF
ncbi:sensor histidine kinase [Paenibacillus oryzisoli]|uniref:sensor histidine kinase n=1 Tax=Paenibacillus oryzisoli TaxID=1850517 RepID=UPI003D265592